MGSGNRHDREDETGSLNVVQVTDSHLFASEDATLVGMNCHESFESVLEMIRQQQDSLDCVLCTGDLVQDASAEGYRRFYRHVETLGAPQLWIPGNHDENVNMKLAVGESNDCLRTSLVLAPWQFIMLDSHVEGKIYGFLTAGELERLDQLLQASQAEGQHVLISVHHNPVPVNAAWLQNHCLKNPDDLFHVMDRYDHVKALVFGHVHQEIDVERKGVKILASPSTSIQFDPDNDRFALDERNPGYRWFRLGSDGSIESGVERVKDRSFDIDFTSSGY